MARQYIAYKDTVVLPTSISQPFLRTFNHFRQPYGKSTSALKNILEFCRRTHATRTCKKSK